MWISSETILQKKSKPIDSSHFGLSNDQFIDRGNTATIQYFDGIPYFQLKEQWTRPIDLVVTYLRYLKQLIDQRISSASSVIFICDHRWHEVITQSARNAGFGSVKTLSEEDMIALSVQDQVDKKVFVLSMQYSFSTIITFTSGVILDHVKRSSSLGIKQFEDAVYDTMIGPYPKHVVSSHSVVRFQSMMENARKELGIVDNFPIRITLFFKEADLKTSITSEQWNTWNKEKMSQLESDIKVVLSDLHPHYCFLIDVELLKVAQHAKKLIGDCQVKEFDREMIRTYLHMNREELQPKLDTDEIL